MIEYEGKFLRVIKRNNWEFAERTNCTAVVAIFAYTKENKVVLVKQYREPMQSIVLEVPAGLVGDINSKESIVQAARRELLEETGYLANKLEVIGKYACSPGLITEVATFVIATELEKQTDGGGDSSENITVQEFSDEELMLLLESPPDNLMIDNKVLVACLFHEMINLENTLRERYKCHT